MYALVFLAILSVILVGIEYSFAEQGTNVDSITFIGHPDENTAINAIQSGIFDMYYNPIPSNQIDNTIPDGIQIFDSTGNVTYNLYINPADVEGQFNPFALTDIRYSLNYLVDRNYVVDELLGGNGHTMLSNFQTNHPDYLLVYRNLEDRGFVYNPMLADEIITSALLREGATEMNNIWHMDGNPITITIFIRNDDPVRDSIGRQLQTELQDIGFVVNVTEGSLDDAFAVVYGSNPSDFQWHIYTGAYGGSPVSKYDNKSLATYYAPWACSMPGTCSDNPDYWHYEHRLLDLYTQYLYFEAFDNPAERAELIRGATEMGVNESVRVAIASANARYATADDITGVVTAQGHGISNRATPINADTNDNTLSIGVKYITQSSWNPIDGFGDTYSSDIYSTLRDPATVRDPFTGDLTPVRVQWDVTTNGPSGTIDIPADAVNWNPVSQKWEPVGPDSTAVSRVILDYEFSNWHNGEPMEINDILYPLYLVNDWTSGGSTNEADNQKYDPNLSAIPSTSQGIRIVGPSTVEIYTSYWHFDDDEIAADSLIWSGMPWEIYAAMESVVLDGTASWSTQGAVDNGIPWLSLLDSDHSELVKEALMELKSDNMSPEGLYHTTDVNSRYDASIQWITDKKNAVISHGPFYLETYDPDAMTLTVRAFDDPTYPLEAGHWNYLAEDHPDLDGTITIGSLAPITGGATVYGQEISATSMLAVEHFNDYLKEIDAGWQLAADRRDTETNSVSALREIASLNDAGINIIDGPGIDYDVQLLDYANDNEMLLVSCCSATSQLAGDNDAMFRIAPGHAAFADSLAQVMSDDDITTVIPIGINNIWVDDLLGLTAESFEGMDAENSIRPRISYNEITPHTVQTLADAVEAQIRQVGSDKVAVLYGGFQENVDLMVLAANHDVLREVKWYGADLNTVWPNMTINDVARQFAEDVGLTSVQPRVAHTGNVIIPDIQEHISGEDFQRPPSVYAFFEYDAVWLIGLAILESQSTDTEAVREALADVSRQYVGATGYTELNSSGDRANGTYSAWKIIDGAWTEIFEVGGPILAQNSISGMVFSDINGNGKFDDGRTIVDYQFTNPITSMLEKKRATLVLHDNLVFGAGHTIVPDVRETVVIKSANDAIDLYRQDGTAAFADITAQNVAAEDGYPFVFRADTTEIVADGSVLDRRGQIPWDDVERKAVLGAVVNDLEAGSGAWITYVHEHPSTGELQSKRSWVMMVDEYVFGSGYYPTGDAAQAIQVDWSIAKAIALYDIRGKDIALDTINAMFSTSQYYPIILDTDSTILAHGANSILAGMLATENSTYHKALKVVLAELENYGTSSTTYEYANPLTLQTEYGYVYLVLHDNLVFGAGHTIAPDVRETVVIKSANDAIDLYRQDGTAAFADITAQNVAAEDGYPFVFRADTTEIVADGSVLDRRGQIPWDDVERKAVLGAVVNDLEAGSGAWITYVHEHPSTGELQSKRSWVMMVDEYVFGSGYYPTGDAAQAIQVDWSIAKAIALYDIRGKDIALDTINAMFSTSQYYPFVMNTDTELVAHGASSMFVGLMASAIADFERSEEEILAELEGSSDYGISGITLQLRDPSGQYTTKETSRDGTYTFMNTEPGDYTVGVSSIPKEYIPSMGVSNPRTITLDIAQKMTADFALELLHPDEYVTLNVAAYDDANANGMRDAGEEPFPDVLVLAYTPSTTRADLLVTGPDGMADISIAPSEFYAIALLPEGYRATTHQFMLGGVEYMGVLHEPGPRYGSTHDMELGITQDGS